MNRPPPGTSQTGPARSSGSRYWPSPGPSPGWSNRLPPTFTTITGAPQVVNPASGGRKPPEGITLGGLTPPARRVGRGSRPPLRGEDGQRVRRGAGGDGRAERSVREIGTGSGRRSPRVPSNRRATNSPEPDAITRTVWAFADATFLPIAVTDPTGDGATLYRQGRRAIFAPARPAGQRVASSGDEFRVAAQHPAESGVGVLPGGRPAVGRVGVLRVFGARSPASGRRRGSWRTTRPPRSPRADAHRPASAEPRCRRVPAIAAGPGPSCPSGTGLPSESESRRWSSSRCRSGAPGRAGRTRRRTSPGRASSRPRPSGDSACASSESTNTPSVLQTRIGRPPLRRSAPPSRIAFTPSRFVS